MNRRNPPVLTTLQWRMSWSPCHPSKHAIPSTKAAGCLTATNATKDKEEEGELKGHVMNSRMAQKIKMEMEIGLQFCEALQTVICQTLHELQEQQQQEQQQQQ